MPLPIIAGIAIGAVAVEVAHRTIKFVRTTKVERAESALEEAEELLSAAKKNLSNAEEEAKAPKRAKAKT